MESLWNPYGCWLAGWLAGCRLKRDTGPRQLRGNCADGQNVFWAVVWQSEMRKRQREVRTPTLAEALFGEYMYMYIYIYIQIHI